MELTLAICALLLVAAIVAGFVAQTHKPKDVVVDDVPPTWKLSIVEKREEEKRLASAHNNVEAIRDQLAIASYDRVKKGL